MNQIDSEDFDEALSDGISTGLFSGFCSACHREGTVEEVISDQCAACGCEFVLKLSNKLN